MNPFDFRGPEFLIFYATVCIATIVAHFLIQRIAESGRPRPLPLNDPYEIAWLRGGTIEAVRMAVLSLVDRGILEFSEVPKGLLGLKRQVLGRRGGATPSLPLERAICDVAATPIEAVEIIRDKGIQAIGKDYRAQLAEIGLIPDEGARAGRILRTMLAVAIVLGVGGIKLLLALVRNKPNVGFLIIMGVVSAGILVLIALRRRSALGDAMLSDLRNLLDALKRNVGYRQGTRVTSDILLLAAVFGLQALPGGPFATVHTFFRSASGSSSCGGGSSCGSGCGGGGRSEE